MRYYRKVLHISAEDSPNVRLGLYQQKNRKPITDEVVVPGVLTFREYVKRRETWDKVKQCISLDGRFYEGAEVLLYPPEWLDRANRLADDLLRGQLGLPAIPAERQARGIGVDPGEGGDDTAWAVVDEYGLIEMISKQTPDTSVITGDTIALMKRHGVPPESVCFDRGGGGLQHADRLRYEGYNVNTVAFGEAVTPDPRRGTVALSEKMSEREEKYVYKNRRAELYGYLRVLLDPATEGHGFAIPPLYAELRRQLAPIPLLYDDEGRLYMLPKNRRGAARASEPTLTDLLGRSPDEADALVLAVHALKDNSRTIVVGAL